MNSKFFTQAGAAVILPARTSTLGNAVASFLRHMLALNAARRSLQQARSLDDRMLEDVGLTRADLRREGYFDFFGR